MDGPNHQSEERRAQGNQCCDVPQVAVPPKFLPLAPIAEGPARKGTARFEKKARQGCKTKTNLLHLGGGGKPAKCDSMGLAQNSENQN